MRGCSSAAACVRKARTHVVTDGLTSPATGPIHRTTKSEHIEVWHINGMGRDGSIDSYAQVLDPSASGWWFYRRVGTGIWYDTGRALLAPTKNAMLLALIDEHGLRGRAADAELDATLARLKLVDAPAGVVRARLVRALNQTVDGVACSKVGLRGCRDDYQLGRLADPLNAYLGRKLLYDSLIYTAVVRTGRWREAPCWEVTDLRLPDSRLFEGARGSHAVHDVTLTA
jgi:hypothetical protein